MSTLGALGVGAALSTPASLAAAELTLTGTERELGTVLIDIGAETCDIAVFYQNAVVHTAVLPIGGAFITRDVAIGLKTSLAAAEELKFRTKHNIEAVLTSFAAFDATFAKYYSGAALAGAAIETFRKGEKGIVILAPMVGKVKSDGELTEVLDPQLDEMLRRGHARGLQVTEFGPVEPLRLRLAERRRQHGVLDHQRRDARRLQFLHQLGVVQLLDQELLSLLLYQHLEYHLHYYLLNTADQLNCL